MDEIETTKQYPWLLIEIDSQVWNSVLSGQGYCLGKTPILLLLFLSLSSRAVLQSCPHSYVTFTAVTTWSVFCRKGIVLKLLISNINIPRSCSHESIIISFHDELLPRILDAEPCCLYKSLLTLVYTNGDHMSFKVLVFASLQYNPKQCWYRIHSPVVVSAYVVQSEVPRYVYASSSGLCSFKMFQINRDNLALGILGSL